MNGSINPSIPTKNIGSFSLFNATGTPAHRHTGKINWYKQTLLFAFLMICSTFITTQQSYGQSWEDAVMDSVLKIFPPDSHYVKNEVIIKFKKHALNLNALCYDYTLGSTLSTSTQLRQPGQIALNDTLITFLQNQVFSVDSVILDVNLRNRMKFYGGDSLMRVSLGNPCVDTLSITRQGDTIESDFYLFLLLKLNNDTSVAPTCVWLTTFHQNQLDYVVPNCINIPTSVTPNDFHYSKQKFLQNDYIGANTAWQFQVGNKNTLVAVFDIDNIDPYHCDLNNSWVDKNKKVIEVKGLTTSIGTHATCAAGIIGAHTNKEGCTTFEGGAAGIAGGWGELGGDGFRGTGASLLSYSMFNDRLNLMWIDAACTYSPHSGQGAGVHIANFGYTRSVARSNLLDFEEAINKMFDNGVAIVASRGNISEYYKIKESDYVLPACFDSHKIMSVGASDKKIGENNLISSYSCFGRNVDVVAPAPKCTGNDIDRVIYTPTLTQYFINGTWQTIQSWMCFDGTSAAAPQVTGAYALLHSWALDEGIKLYPEDYEGMIKASATDLYASDYPPNYDPLTGWGQLNLKTLFFMLQSGYYIYHYDIENYNDFTYPNFPTSTHNVNVSNLQDTSGSVNSGNWNVYMRPVTYEVSHSCQWHDNEGHRIHVWGRSGKLNGKHGFGPTNPPESQEFGFAGTSTLFQNGYTGVLSGTGGNNLVSNMNHSGSHLTNSHKFNLVTYQYKFKNVWGDFTRPIKENLAMHYTVFAKVCGDNPCCVQPPTSILEQDPLYKLRIMPSITSSQIELASDMLPNQHSILTVTNSNGEVMFIKNKFYSNRYLLKTTNFPNGRYFVKIQNGDFISSESFIIQR